jgi:hypothetical protein
MQSRHASPRPATPARPTSFEDNLVHDNAPASTHPLSNPCTNIRQPHLVRVRRLLLVEDVPDDNPDLETWSVGNVISEHTNRCTDERVLRIRFMNGDEQDVCQCAVHRLHARISRAPKHSVLPYPVLLKSGVAFPLQHHYMMAMPSQQTREVAIPNHKSLTATPAVRLQSLREHFQEACQTTCRHQPPSLYLPRSPKFRAKRPALTESQGMQRERRAWSTLSQI